MSTANRKNVLQSPGTGNNRAKEPVVRVKPMSTKPVQLLVAGLAVFLLAEDVERPPIIIEPPPEKKIEPPPVPPPAPREPKISIPGPIRLRLDPSLPPMPPEPQPEPELTEHQRVKLRIDGYFRDLLARRRVQSGSVDPGWYYLATRMDHYWSPDFSLVHDAKITSVSGAWLKKEVWDWLSGWYRSVQSSPYGAEEDPREMIDTTTLNLQRDAYFDDGYGSTVTTLVEVRITREGALSARLFESSGHPQFDRAAVEAVKTAIELPDERDLPPGPARSIYALNARYAILPPLPVVGFAFDLSLGYFDWMYPLKKLVTGNSTLIAAYRDK
jgi:TonB family protein